MFVLEFPRPTFLAEQSVVETKNVGENVGRKDPGRYSSLLQSIGVNEE